MVPNKWMWVHRLATPVLLLGNAPNPGLRWASALEVWECLPVIHGQQLVAKAAVRLLEADPDR